MGALREVILESNHNLALRTGLRNQDPKVLVGFDLTAEESEALLAGDEEKIYRLLNDTQYHHLRENGNYVDDCVSAVTDVP
jgi:hypothetical protein